MRTLEQDVRAVRKELTKNCMSERQLREKTGFSKQRISDALTQMNLRPVRITRKRTSLFKINPTPATRRKI